MNPNKITASVQSKYVGQVAQMSGWAKFVRTSGKRTFIELYDGTGMIQLLVEGELAKSLGPIPTQTCLSVTGLIKADARSKSGHELSVQGFEIVGTSVSDIESKFNVDSGRHVMFDQRHLVHRMEKGSDEYRLVKYNKIKAELCRAFEDIYREREFTRIFPPTIVSSQCEGGSTLFNLNIKDDYFGQKAYMTQSSQFYLEAMVPVHRKVFCIERSYRAEDSATARHLSEFTHVEGELGFIEFTDLLQHIEELICTVTKLVTERCGSDILSLNPTWAPYVGSFERIRYRNAVKILADNGVTNKEGIVCQYGDDLTDSMEKKLLQIVGKPIFLTHFPANMKAFYMARDPECPSETLSVDTLLPGLGEVVGASMRITDYTELMAAYAREKLDPTPYYMYTDLRKYGSCPHGGYGLGLERLMMLMIGADSVKECCTFPRYYGRSMP